MKETKDIKLEFYGTCNYTVVQNAEKIYRSGSKITLPMQAGGGVLIVFE